MLGYSGHFSTKSRAYSTTLSALRNDRARHQREHTMPAGLTPSLDSATTLVLAHWNFAGRVFTPVRPRPATTTTGPGLPAAAPGGDELWT
jgi:hypothetical protein